jgi:hypothetical protein
MRDSFTPEEVDRIENTAFEVGFRIGGSQERSRILALLEARLNDLESCLKDDDCQVRADSIKVCISDIKENKNG